MLGETYIWQRKGSKDPPFLGRLTYLEEEFQRFLFDVNGIHNQEERYTANYTWEKSSVPCHKGKVIKFLYNKKIACAWFIAEDEGYLTFAYETGDRMEAYEYGDAYTDALTEKRVSVVGNCDLYWRFVAEFTEV